MCREVFASVKWDKHEQNFVRPERGFAQYWFGLYMLYDGTVLVYL